MFIIVIVHDSRDSCKGKRFVVYILVLKTSIDEKASTYVPVGGIFCCTRIFYFDKRILVHADVFNQNI